MHNQDKQNWYSILIFLFFTWHNKHYLPFFVMNYTLREKGFSTPFYYIPSSEILVFPNVINFHITTSDDINFHFHFCCNLGTTFFFHYALIDRKIKNYDVIKVYNK